MSVVKNRQWLFVFYPESAPAEWRDIVAEWQMPVLVSPLHDSDFREDGSLKKAHYHGILIFDGPTTYKKALSVVEDLGCSTVKSCNSLKGAARYLCHLDSPDKTQYNVSDVSTFGGADLTCLLDEGTEMDKVFTSLCKIIDDNNITEFAELVQFVINEKPEFLRVVRGNVGFFTSYLASKRGIISKS